MYNRRLCDTVPSRVIYYFPLLVFFCMPGRMKLGYNLPETELGYSFFKTRGLVIICRSWCVLPLDRLITHTPGVC